MLSWVSKQMSFNTVFHWSAHDVLRAFTHQFCYDVQTLSLSFFLFQHEVLTLFSVGSTDGSLYGSTTHQRSCVNIAPKIASIRTCRWRRRGSIITSWLIG